jgi:hypothetical protein
MTLQVTMAAQPHRGNIKHLTTTTTMTTTVNFEHALDVIDKVFHVLLGVCNVVKKFFHVS